MLNKLNVSICIDLISNYFAKYSLISIVFFLELSLDIENVSQKNQEIVLQD